MSAIENAKLIDVRGGMWDVTITYDNGYIMKAAGELQPKAKFCVYKRSMKAWQPPHDMEEFTSEDLMKIIADVTAKNGPDCVQIIFE